MPTKTACRDYNKLLPGFVTSDKPHPQEHAAKGARLSLSFRLSAQLQQWTVPIIHLFSQSNEKYCTKYTLYMYACAVAVLY